jgi:hypothetical protein
MPGGPPVVHPGLNCTRSKMPSDFSIAPTRSTIPSKPSVPKSAVPIDFVPDFLPVVGYPDHAILISLTPRSVVRQTGIEAVRRRWPGTPAGLTALWRATGLPVLHGDAHLRLTKNPTRAHSSSPPGGLADASPRRPVDR